MKLEAIFDSVIVKPLDIEDTMYGNIIVPDLGKEKSLIGEVVSVGPGRESITGEKFIPTTVKKKTTVILPPTGATRFEFEGDEYYICSEKTILAIIKNEKK